MKKVETYGNIHDGNLKISYRENFIEALKGLGNGKVRVIVEKLYGVRSEKQNAYLHGYLFKKITQLLWLRGWSKSEINPEITKEFLKNKFLSYRITNEETGEGIDYRKDTHELSTTEVSTFIDDVIKWGTVEFAKELDELGEILLYPGEQSELDFAGK